MVKMHKNYPYHRFIIVILFFLVSLYTYDQGFHLFRFINYFVGILLGVAIYLIAWNTRHYIRNSLFIILGVSLLSVFTLQSLSLVFMQSVHGLSFLPDFRLSDIFNIYSNFFLSVMVLTALLTMQFKINYRLLIIILQFIVGFLFLDGVYFHGYPFRFFITAPMLTANIVLGVSISLLFLSSIILFRKRSNLNPYVFLTLFIFIVFKVISLIFSMLPVIEGSIVNFFPSFLRLISILFLYESYIASSLRRPAQVLFRNINIQLNELAEGMMNGLACIRRDQFGEFRIIETNQRFSKSTGLQFKDVYRRPIDHVFGSDLLPWIKEVDATRKSIRREFSSPILDRDFIISLFPYGADFLALAFFDITEKKKLAEQLRQAEKMGAIGELAGGISHDFNNQLSALDSMVQILMDKNSDPDLEEGFFKLTTAIERSTNLTQQLLSFSRKNMDEKNEITFNELLDEVYNILILSSGSRIAVTKHLNAEDSRIIGDEGLLENALLNLGINARDAQPEGGEIILQTRNVELAPGTLSRFSFPLNRRHYLEITVSDKGAGIDSETLSKIFQPFFTTKRAGSGMGLSMVYRCMELHRGDIRLETVPGLGTSISLLLPLARTAKESVKRAIEKSQPRELSLEGVRILVIDDEELIRENIVRLLRKEKAEVFEAGDGEGALELCKKENRQWDYLVIDHLLPDIKGLDLLERLSPWLRKAVKVLITGFADDYLDNRARELGIKKVLIKPVKIKKLLDALR